MSIEHELHQKYETDKSFYDEPTKYINYRIDNYYEKHNHLVLRQILLLLR